MGMVCANASEFSRVPRWTDDYVLGIECVDREHSIVFTLLGLLENEVILSRKDDAIRRNILTFMTEFIHSHFDREEMLMHRIGYPHAAEHRALHERFKSLMTQAFDRFGRNAEHDIASLGSLSEWWVSHILAEDRRHVDFAACGAVPAVVPS